MLREPIEEAFASIDALQKLEAGWDSYDADTITASARDQAKQLLRNVASVCGRQFAGPIVSPTPEGGVALIWRDKGRPKVEVFCSSSAARYAVFEKGELIEQGPVATPASFALNVIKRYVTS